MQIKLSDGVFMVSGTATKDAEYKRVGEKQSAVCTFGLAVGKNKDTTTIFANCKAWRGLADYAAGIRKRDSVCAIGTIEEREYNGKTYKTLVLEWLHYIPSGSSAEYQPAQPPVTKDTFRDLTDDPESDLPF